MAALKLPGGKGKKKGGVKGVAQKARAARKAWVLVGTAASLPLLAGIAIVLIVLLVLVLVLGGDMQLKQQAPGGIGADAGLCSLDGSIGIDGTPSIVGGPTVTKGQFEGWWQESHPLPQANNANNPQADAHQTVAAITDLYWQEGQAESIRPDMAEIQMILETGSWSNNDVLSGNNPAGIAHYDNADSGTYFPTAQMGIRAQIQYLKRVVYGNDVVLANPPAATENGTPIGDWGGRKIVNWGAMGGVVNGAAAPGGWATDPDYWSKLSKLWTSLLDYAQSHGGVGAQPVSDGDGAPETSDTSAAPGEVSIGALSTAVPEPARTQLMLAAQAANVDPAAVAALYLTEQNGFSFMYRFYDSGQDPSAFHLTDTSSEWKQIAGGSMEWPSTSSTFRGPFQFGPIWESTYRTAEHPDVYNFDDAAFGAAQYLSDLGATGSDLASIRKAAKSYNGQKSWDVGGGIRNPDPDKYRLVQDLYADQVVHLTQALSGGGGSGSALCQGEQQAVSGTAGSIVQWAAHGDGLPYSQCRPDCASITGQHDCHASGFSPSCRLPAEDCSGFTRWVFWNALGIDIGSNSRAQLINAQKKGWMVFQTGDLVGNKDKLQPGDLLFYSYGSDASSTHHVNIYIGNGMINEASTYGQLSATRPLYNFSSVMSVVRVPIVANN